MEISRKAFIFWLFSISFFVLVFLIPNTPNALLAFSFLMFLIGNTRMTIIGYQHMKRKFRNPYQP